MQLGAAPDLFSSLLTLAKVVTAFATYLLKPFARVPDSRRFADWKK